jgi:hypothetical protein
MPAYTIGLLSPVPFLFAALTQRTLRLWFIAAAYTASWIGTCVFLALTPDNSSFSALCGFAIIALAAAGTTHALVLRQSLPPRHPTNLIIVSQQPVGFPAIVEAGGQATTVAQLQAALSSLQTYATVHGNSLPPTCSQLLDETIQQIQPVLTFAARGAHVEPQLRAVEAVLTDYLPTSLNTYARLPDDYALTQRDPDGRTAAEELELQLRLLRDAVKEAAASIHRDDAMQLEAQSAFLESKFGTSELDLS